MGTVVIKAYEIQSGAYLAKEEALDKIKTFLTPEFYILVYRRESALFGTKACWYIATLYGKTYTIEVE